MHFHSIRAALTTAVVMFALADSVSADPGSSAAHLEHRVESPAPAVSQGGTAAPQDVSGRGALADFRADRTPQLESWQRANDNVARIGGWRAYAREAQANSQDAETSVRDPHAGDHAP